MYFLCIFPCDPHFYSTERREPTITTVREELPLVDPPKVTLHDDMSFLEQPFTIQLSSSNNQSSYNSCLLMAPTPEPSITLNGGPCNHMGGGEMVLLSGAGREDASIMESLATELEHQGIATETAN